MTIGTFEIPVVRSIKELRINDVSGFHFMLHGLRCNGIFKRKFSIGMTGKTFLVLSLIRWFLFLSGNTILRKRKEWNTD
jgi:hypothetical protein